MKKSIRFSLFSVLMLGAYLVSACSGVPAPSTGDESNTNGSAATPTIVGDNGNDANANDVNSNDSNSNDANSNDANSNDDNSNISTSAEIEIFGAVESITETTITINGVTYNIIADLTEFRDIISVGSQVKVHVIVNADGTFTIREIEISSGDDNANANGNDNGNTNDNTNGNDNGNTNGNDNGNDNANSNDNDNGNSNDNGNDNGGGGNDNDDGGNDNGGGNDND